MAEPVVEELGEDGPEGIGQRRHGREKAEEPHEALARQAGRAIGHDRRMEEREARALDEARDERADDALMGQVEADEAEHGEHRADPDRLQDADAVGERAGEQAHRHQRHAIDGDEQADVARREADILPDDRQQHRLLVGHGGEEDHRGQAGKFAAGGGIGKPAGASASPGLTSPVTPSCSSGRSRPAASRCRHDRRRGRPSRPRARDRPRRDHCRRTSGRCARRTRHPRGAARRPRGSARWRHWRGRDLR